ncbi:TPA: hypothetical protein OMD89_002065 [Klebsiella oxytoca]|nr:hypothetical protein [Klebsiella oxytoca]HCQ8705896.1 hypothetical protein [Klebsiella oxytoca]
MKKTSLHISLALIAAASLAGCDTANDMSNENFEKAINEILENYCIPLRTGYSFPVVDILFSTESQYHNRFDKLNILVKAGLLSAEKEDIIKYRKKAKLYTYKLTKEGERYIMKKKHTVYFALVNTKFKKLSISLSHLINWGECSRELITPTALLRYQPGRNPKA